LLRRLALREGAQFTFAPNSETFREIVHFKFEQLLADLFRRGAFAGRDPTAAFQVVTDDSVNTPASIDQGRFIIELRVAPSHPLAFITIRLVQQRSNGVLVQEV
jgi:phage tail sheath protein FI